MICVASNIDIKKDRSWCEEPLMKHLVVIFIIFNHLAKLLFCLHYCISSDCSPTMLVKTSDQKAYFQTKNMASQICCFLFFYFPTQHTLFFSYEGDLYWLYLLCYYFCWFCPFCSGMSYLGQNVYEMMPLERIFVLFGS